MEPPDLREPDRRSVKCSQRGGQSGREGNWLLSSLTWQANVATRGAAANACKSPRSRSMHALIFDDPQLLLQSTREVDHRTSAV